MSKGLVRAKGGIVENIDHKLNSKPENMQKVSHNSVKISVENVSKIYQVADAEDVPVLKDVNIDIRNNEFVSLVGRSGCGKTTLLNILAGLVPPSSGIVRIDGTTVTGPGDGKGMVFQQHALFPWLTTIENVAFGCKSKGMRKADRTEIAMDLVKLVGLDGYQNHYPRELSGGMQQRVAIARALALDPEILLMDEPFGALDEMTRLEMQDELLRIWEVRKKTVVFVTHSLTEALVLSDRIFLMGRNPGGIRREFSVPFSRPRHRSSVEFLEMYEDIWAGL